MLTAVRRGKRFTVAVSDRISKLRILAASMSSSSGATAVNYEPDTVRRGVDIRQQSILLPGPERIRVSAYVNESRYRSGQFYSDATTVYEAFKRGQRVSNDGPFLGARTGPNGRYEWMSFSEVDERCRLFGSGLIAMGEKPGGSTCIGIFSQNRPEWTISDLTCVQYSMVSVPLYNSLGWESCKYIVNKTNMSTLVVDNTEKASTIVDHADAMPTLRRVVVMDLPSEGAEDLHRRYAAAGLELHSFQDVIQHGVQNVADQVLPTPDDLNTICFTSGTTGQPKGVPLRHRHHIANHDAVFSTHEDSELFDHQDIHFSLLPIAHVYERGNIYNIMINGTQVGYFGGDMLKLLDDAQELKPTIFTGVPRLFNRLYDKIKGSVDSGSAIKRALFYHAYNQKLKDLENGTLSNDTIWDRIVFKKVQDLLGGRIRYLFSGGAPISGEVITFIRCLFGCYFVQAYGQTETTSCITHTLPSDPTSGHLGPPSGGTELKLVDVPELDYFASENKGEICMRAQNVFEGYLDNPEQTAETLDEDGWIHTGDIGEWTEIGTIRVIDRKKHIFKLAHGVYIAPEKVENVYVRNQLVMQVFVYGDSTKASMVGIVVPDPDVIPGFAEKLGVKGSLTELCQDERVKSAILTSMNEQGSSEGLLGFEQVKDICLHAEPFSEENGLLTPSLKNKRPDITKAFAAEIEDMYSNLE
ncbi:long-chain-fatty-acid--CoA ligase 5-like [Diadema setosum]|uniref:long-chain-fatty-acid--CoA ligase 5-like n=1 Tax=Diadema setosum TaxID=31175 RepID=UPI003B3B2063